jgi:hypothetical protein
MLAAEIRIGAVTRPKPMVGAFVFVEDGFGFVGNEDGFARCHGRDGTIGLAISVYSLYNRKCRIKRRFTFGFINDYQGAWV